MTVHVFETMGTVASLRIDEGTVPDSAIARIEAVFGEYDRTFSLYDAASPLSRVARGESTLADAGPGILRAYEVAIDWRNRTAGAFTPHRPDGVVDLSGVVKAFAIRDAGAVLDEHSDSWLLTVGGDVLARGDVRPAPWRVGVVDPDDRERVAALVTLGSGRRAVATSGTAERGEHIWTRGEDAPFVQATVAAADIVTADVLATAVMAGSHADLDRITSEWDVDVLAFDGTGGGRATPGARAWLENSA
ncbi:FAD:protein FMN transferase [Frondihabitans sp. 762G35]|uniref:FAD:protein FMN transferase n=1 Tax=Frondihabitans sp. 762G35 TaxID=1446794 RepID=UPI000D22C071|nr:FAD:protein FMN transferase [Frondihabitans sp. 762G35]ARC57915.1 FAD:protein FMN transferase [Frondihabitans sp. 762G35]